MEKLRAALTIVPMVSRASIWLAPGQASLPLDVERFAEAARDHWSVENCLHWGLDISFREDDRRVRKGHAPENLAILRRFAISLIKRDPLGKKRTIPFTYSHYMKFQVERAVDPGGKIAGVTNLRSGRHKFRSG